MSSSEDDWEKEYDDNFNKLSHKILNDEDANDLLEYENNQNLPNPSKKSLEPEKQEYFKIPWNKKYVYRREKIKNSSVIQNKDAKLYIEENKRKKKKKTETKSEKLLVRNKLFDPWQNQLSEKITEGKNIILDVATSCGKTWAVRTIITEHILSTNDTAIFITPNIEILFENYRSLLKENKKTYNYSTQRIAGIQTLSKTNIQNSNIQIMFITGDNIMEFFCDSFFEEFIKKIKFIILDEVHIEVMQLSLWKSLYLPLEPQYILLSATLQNTENIVTKFKSLVNKDIELIKYSIRPIPLQTILLKKDVQLSNEGVKISNGKNSLLYSLNINDPTKRDVEFLNKKFNIEYDITDEIINDREKQYYLGKEIVSKLNEDNYKELEKMDNNNYDNCVSTYTNNNILVALQNLYSNNLNPAIIFNDSSAECISIAKDLLKLLQFTESNDEELKKSFKHIERMEKLSKRKRDKEPERKNVNCAEDAQANSQIFIPVSPNKWRFPYSNRKLLGSNIPEWINDLLQYGIGIHTKSIKGYIRRQMFDFFENKDITIMISDKSLSVGVNLPVRTVILTGNIDQTLYTQMSGRAGRRGYDTEGYVLPLLQRKINENLEAKYIREDYKLSSLDIISVNNKISKLKTELIEKYINYSESNKLLYESRLSWLKESNLISNPYSKLAIVLENEKMLCFVKFLTSGLLMNYLNERIILLYLSSIFIGSKNCEFIDFYDKSYNNESFNKLYIKFVKELQDFNSECVSENEKVYIDDKCMIIYNFYKNAKLDNNDKDIVSKFQRSLFTLMGLIKDLYPEDDKLINIFKKIDENIWNKCRINNIKV